MTCIYRVPYSVYTDTNTGGTMQYAVVTIGSTYHIGNTSTGMTMCAQPQSKWTTMLNSRNKTLVGCYSIVMGRNAACPMCEHQGANWRTVNA